MEDLRCEPADGMDVEALTEAFNRAFEGYYVPLRQTRETLLAMMENNDVRLADSVVALDQDGQLAGIGLLAVRGSRAWVAGMGVAPGWRGRGQGEAVLRWLIERARGLGLRTMQLEVLEQNVPARRLYARMGFRELRPLLVYNGPPERMLATGGATAAEDARLAPMEVADALAHFEEMHVVAPSWQRERASLEHMAAHLEATGLFAEDQLRAYALVNRAAVGVAVLDLGAGAASAEERARDAEGLLRGLLSRRGQQVVRAINVPPGDPLDEALRRLGCAVMSQQRELELAIDGAV